MSEKNVGPLWLSGRAVPVSSGECANTSTLSGCGGPGSRLSTLDAITFDTTEPPVRPVPVKIHAVGSATARGACTPSFIVPLKASPISVEPGQLAGGELHLLLVTSLGSPWPLAGSAAGSR